MADRKSIERSLRERHKLDKDARVGVQSMGVSPSVIRVKAVSDPDEPVRVSAVASTASVDLSDEVLIPSGADLSTFRAYKSILYEHDPMRVLGRLVDINYNPHQDHLFASFDIITRDNPQNAAIASLVREGAINGVSVGFIRKSWGPPQGDEVTRYEGARTIVREWECLELSVVAMPCNRDAIISGVKSGKLSRDTAIYLGVPKEAFAWDAKKSPVAFTSKKGARPVDFKTN